MRSALLVLLVLFLAGFGSAQTVSALPKTPEAEKVSIHFGYTADPEFVVEQCFWHIYEAGKPKDKPVTLTGCQSIDFAFGNGEHIVELVINGRQTKYQHLAIEQRLIVKKVKVGSRVSVE